MDHLPEQRGAILIDRLHQHIVKAFKTELGIELLLARLRGPISLKESVYSPEKMPKSSASIYDDNEMSEERITRRIRECNGRRRRILLYEYSEQQPLI